MVQVNVTEELRDVIKEEVERLASEIEGKYNEKYKGIADELQNLKKSMEMSQEQQNLKNELMSLQLASLKKDVERQNESIDLKFYQLKENFSKGYESGLDETLRSLNQNIKNIQERKSAACDKMKSTSLNESGSEGSRKEDNLEKIEEDVADKILHIKEELQREIDGFKDQYMKLYTDLQKEQESLKEDIKRKHESSLETERNELKRFKKESEDKILKLKKDVQHKVPNGAMEPLKSSLKNVQKNQDEIFKKTKTFEAEINGLKLEYQKIEKKLNDELNSLKKSCEALKGNISRNAAKNISTGLRTSPVKIPILGMLTVKDLKQFILSNQKGKWIEDFLKLFPDGMCFCMLGFEKYLICPRSPGSYIKESCVYQPQQLIPPVKISTIEGEITVTSKSLFYFQDTFLCNVIPDKLLPNYAAILGLDFLNRESTKMNAKNIKIGHTWIVGLYDCHDE